MSTFKRILLYAAMVISILVLVLSVAGIIGAWAYNTPATEAILDILVPVTNALQRSEELVNTTGQSLTRVSTALDTAGSRVQEIGDDVAEKEIVLEAASLIVGEDVRPALQEASDSIRSVYDTVGALEEAIQTFNAIPFIDVEVPGAEPLGNLRTGMEEVATTAEDLVVTLQEKKAEIVSETVTEVTQPIDRLNSRVGEIRTGLADLETRLGASITNLLRLQEELPSWIDMLCIATTVFLLWVIISQIAVFVLCRKMLQGKLV